jgi:hypothetical protein
MAKHVIRISEAEAANDFASLDPDFAEDVEEILSHRKPWNPPSWE